MLSLALGLAALQTAAPIVLQVDASEVSRNVVRVAETISLRPGRRALYFPEYIPGEHRASGPINGMVDLKFTAGGRTLTWDRDSVDLYQLWVEVPSGAREVKAEFNFVTDPGDALTPNLARLSWNRLLLYPEGATDRLPIRPELRVPEGWSVASALNVRQAAGPQTSFGTVSVTELVDSPAEIGRYVRSYSLGEIAGAPVGMDVMADQEGYEKLPDAQIDRAKALVREAGSLFGGRHFRQYRFLVTLSDAGAGAGLEHHESSEDGQRLRAGADPYGLGGLLAHEFTHSWNGKYRRPVGLATPDYHTPMKGDGLWVYEGLTQYLGYVLAARSGFWTPEQWLDTWAGVARNFQLQGGRTWRPVVDTARSVGLVRGVGGAWSRERRGTDYYTEGALVWLEADALIREGTKGTRSLDDFLKRFHGGVSGAPVVKPYTTEDVAKALNETYAYDWRTFLRDRIDRLNLETPARALERAGYRIVLNDKPATTGSRSGTRPQYLPMLGMSVGSDGAVSEVALDGPAYRAGIVAGAKVTAFDGREFDRDELIGSVTKPGAGRISLSVSRYGRVQSVEVPYEGGPFVPHLEAIPGHTAWLDQIAKAKTAG